MDPCELYRVLLGRYPVPPVWSEDPYVVMVQSVMVQNTSWGSVISTCARMGNLIRPSEIARMRSEELEDHIRACGFCKRKAAAILSLTDWYSRYGFVPGEVSAVSPETLLTELLAIRGIGRETADVILCYAFGFPVIVIDAYLRVLLRHIGVIFGDDDDIRAYLEPVRSMGTDACRMFHRAVLEHSITVCGRKPKCEACALRDFCVDGSE